MAVSLLLLITALIGQPQAAPYAAVVMDARTGEVLHSRNSNTRLHPASLTKMMTLYIAFEAVRNGEISLDDKVTISRNAAAEPPSKLGLRSGQRIKLRFLLRAAAVKSANDAATAIGEAISGSEAAFARRMTRTAKALGMTHTTFRNAHGLTAEGHLSTARDMTILGRHVLYDYPEYYNLFSRVSADTSMSVVYNTNRRLLGSYRGADGIKTGYTRAAGYNLVASAKRGDERIIATVFGGKSTASRNAKVAELLDLGFRRAPSHARLRRPSRPAYQGNRGIQTAGAASASGVAGKTIRLSGVVKTTPRPRLRPSVAQAIATTDTQLASATPPAAANGLSLLQPAPQTANAAPAAVAEASAVAANQDAMQSGINSLLAEVQQVSLQNAPTPATAPAASAASLARPSTGALKVAAAVPSPALPAYKGPRPRLRPDLSATQATAEAEAAPVVVTRMSTSGGRHWGINVGRYGSRYQAEKVLLRTALSEMETLDGSLRKVVQSPRGFDAHFLGMTEDGAERACSRLRARNMSCDMVGPGHS